VAGVSVFEAGETVLLAGGATTRGVSVAVEDALSVSIPMAEIGELSKLGEAARVAARSALTWVSTLGGIVITNSFGVELD
jgi:hypothetical protein